MYTNCLVDAVGDFPGNTTQSFTGVEAVSCYVVFVVVSPIGSAYVGQFFVITKTIVHML